MINPLEFTTRRRVLTQPELRDVATLLGFTPDRTIEVRIKATPADGVIVEVDSFDDEQ